MGLRIIPKAGATIPAAVTVNTTIPPRLEAFLKFLEANASTIDWDYAGNSPYSNLPAFNPFFKPLPKLPHLLDTPLSKIAPWFGASYKDIYSLFTSLSPDTTLNQFIKKCRHHKFQPPEIKLP